MTAPVNRQALILFRADFSFGVLSREKIINVLLQQSRLFPIGMGANLLSPPAAWMPARL